MNRNSHRDSFWQFIRGVCIAAVVLIHCPTGIGYSGASFYGWFCLRQVINFPVVAFVFMSGYFTSREKVESSASTYLSMRGATAYPICHMESSIFDCLDCCGYPSTREDKL